MMTARRVRYFCAGLLAAVAVVGGVGPVRADSMVIGTLAYSNVQISEVKGDTLFFSVNSQDRSRPIAQITKIALDNEPVFNAAEEAFVVKNWDKAVDGYEKTLRSTGKPWLRQWCSGRLLESASKGGRFDVALKALVELARTDATAAAAVKLTMPRADSAYLPDGIELINDALADARTKPAAQEVLLRVLSDLYNAKNDLAGAATAAARLVQLKATSDPNSPEAQRALVLLKLKTLHLALSSKDYAKVLQTIQKEATAFVEPADQADALWCLAEAKAGLAGDSKDPDVWKEVAIAYMRVVANGPASAPAGPALMKTAEIHAVRLGDAKTAAAIYKQVATEYKGQPLAAEAEKQLAGQR